MKSSSLIAAVADVLQQGRSLLLSVEDEVFARRDSEPLGSSIGAHYRHVLDHFFCLLEGIDSGRINYDERQRSPELESSAAAALLATEQLVDRFRGLKADTLELDCTVRYSVGYGAAESLSVSSNVAREVMFCVGHAIHHYAILKMLCASRSVALPYEFGVAPSTLKYLETQAVSR
jgi:hypothetical protein